MDICRVIDVHKATHDGCGVVWPAGQVIDQEGLPIDEGCIYEPWIGDGKGPLESSANDSISVCVIDLLYLQVRAAIEDRRGHEAAHVQVAERCIGAGSIRPARGAPPVARGDLFCRLRAKQGYIAVADQAAAGHTGPYGSDIYPPAIQRNG